MRGGYYDRRGVFFIADGDEFIGFFVVFDFDV